MTDRTEGLPPEVVEAWRKGRKIEAIRLLREKTGAGLAEAKAAVEALERSEGKASAGLEMKGALPEVISALSSLGAVPPEVADAWRRGDKMAALKWLREQSRTGAAVGKRQTTPGAAATMDAPKAASAKLSSPGPGREALSPGEVPRAKRGHWLFVVLALVLVAVWTGSRLT
jgi:hypothetical protein